MCKTVTASHGKLLSMHGGNTKTREGEWNVQEGGMRCVLCLFLFILSLNGRFPPQAAPDFCIAFGHEFPLWFDFVSMPRQGLRATTGMSHASASQSRSARVHVRLARAFRGLRGQ